MVAGRGPLGWQLPAAPAQADAAVQYGFGRAAEARSPGYSVRSGEESRSEFYGHINLLGPERIVRPLSVGSMYANSPPLTRTRPASSPREVARSGGGLRPLRRQHDALDPPLDLALGNIDFVEVFQFGLLKTDRWYELLNAGFRVTGIAGSDFPANLSKFKPWPHVVPLLGPERTLVKVDAGDASPYDAWADGVRRGAVVVSNGPLLDLAVEGHGPGAVVDLKADAKSITGEARAVSIRPLEAVELLVNGKVVQTVGGDGRQTELRLPFTLPVEGSAWVAARVRSRHEGNEPVLQAHANPVYFLRDRRPVHDPAARRAVLERWKRDVDYYRGNDLVFADPAHRRELQARIDEATRILERDPEPWR
ncbi:MAG: CehA/McbA family metallohydrolase [Isosphaeraceae bacterium]